MRTAEDVLNVIRDRGSRGLPLEDVYRQLYKPALYLRAYDRLYRNEGAMTRGSTQETVDGMSLEKIEALISAVRFERHRWTPVRRVEIPKARQPGKTRPLGIPTWSDKLLQEVMRSLLEAYYEPQFSDHSHGFRPERGCHTALTAIKGTWGGTRWFIEGDIKGCFDNIDHAVLLSILQEQIADHRFLRLVAPLLQAGYLAQWDYHPTLSGTPQGGVISPLLANIYLDRLDQWVEQTLLPEYTRGKRRQESHAYRCIKGQKEKQQALGNRQQAHQLEKQLQRMPSKEAEDPGFRRLHYVRYADDFLLGFLGPRAEADVIKTKLQTFLQDTLHLEMSVEKSLITHATTEAARFLGYAISTQYCDTKHTTGQRSINGKMALRIPAQVIEARCAIYQHSGKPVARTAAIHDSDFAIVDRFQGEYRGYVQYYQLAENIAWLTKLRWVMEVALVKTLARKHTTSGTAIYRQYHGTIQTPHGPRTCLKVIQEREGKLPLVAIFGGIPLRRQKTALLQDQPIYRYEPRRSDLLQRLLAQECEVCGATEKIEVHHLRKLADLKQEGRKEKPLWVQWLSTRRRKTLILCQRCHHQLHDGKLQIPPRAASVTGEPDDRKRSRPVRRGLRHEVAGVIVWQGHNPDQTGCPISRTLRGKAARQRTVKEPSDNEPTACGRAPEPRGEGAPASIMRGGTRVDGMVNPGELSLNAVRTNQPKVLSGWGQKGKVAGNGGSPFLRHGPRPLPANRENLTHPWVIPAEYAQRAPGSPYRSRVRG